MPSIEELRFLSQARAEGRAKALALPQAHLNALINTQREECTESTKALRSDWEESWSKYQSQVDYSDKEDWQSAVWIPMPWASVEQATSILQRSLMDSPDFFKVDGIDRKDKLLAEKVWNPIMKIAYEKASFTHKFVDAIKVSLACGISQYLKFRYPSLPSPILDSLQLDPQTGMVLPQYKMQRQAALTVECVAPWKIYRDPGSRPREQWSGTYIIHEDYVDRAILSSGAASKVYQNIDEVLGSGAGTGGGTDDVSNDADKRGLSWSPHQFRKPVLCAEWYGDILDENGDMCYPDAVMIQANRKTLIYGPADNPLWAVDPRTFRRKWPLVAFSPLGNPLRFEGWGILHAVTPLATLFNNLFNMFNDGLNWKVNVPTELNTALLDEDDDNEHFPGKLWRKIGDGALLTPAQVGQMDTSAVLASLNFMQQLWENNSFVTNFVMGQPGQRSQITKGEVQMKTSQSLGIFEGMGKNIEAGGTACLELSYDFLSQYMTDFSDPAIAAFVGPEYAMLLNRMDPMTRMKTLGGQYNYMFSGITQALQKADMLGRLLQASALAAQGPYVGYTNPSEMLVAIFDALGLRDKITVAEEPAIPISKIGPLMLGAGGGGMPPNGNGGGRPVPMPTMAQMAPTANELGAGGG